MIRQIAEYGKGKCEYVIVEGILTKERYGHMLEHLIHFYNGNVYAFYFDLSFEETLRRHNASDKRNNFGVDSLRSWWNPRDYLGIENETLLTDDMSKDEVLQIILDKVLKQTRSLNSAICDKYVFVFPTYSNVGNQVYNNI